jgi:hypothetical protein
MSSIDSVNDFVAKHSANYKAGRTDIYGGSINTMVLARAVVELSEKVKQLEDQLSKLNGDTK